MPSIEPVVQRRESLTKDEIARYSRHLIMPDVAMEGQERLKASKVLIVGTGGLGSPLAHYLAAAGVGTLGIVDNDVVDASNLQRQVIHTTSMIGKSKVDSAENAIREVNPNTKVVKHETYLTSENALDIVKDYDLVIDGTDNFPTRYLVNDACVLLGKPNVYGSIFRFEGQLSVFYAKEGPCYRCMFPEPPPPGMVPNCAEGGVLGVLCGIIGSSQGIEGIKLIMGIGDPMVGRLGLYDALEQRWMYVKVNKDPDCPVCGENPTITELIDYEEFCGMPAHDREETGEAGDEILPTEYAEDWSKREDVVLIDVREPHEYEISKIEGSILIPKDSLPGKLSGLDNAKTYVMQCKSGARSRETTELMRNAGFKAYNLFGGINAYARQVDQTIPTY